MSTIKVNRDQRINNRMHQFLAEKNPFTRFLIIYGFCLFLSLLFLLIATKSSPLYPFNDWVDANSAFTMGKGMMNGKIIYRDLFVPKGPLWYFLFGLAYLISNTSFLGVFILEVVSFSVFLYFSFKLVSLFLDFEYALISLPLITVSILNHKSFTHGGSPEELSLPLLTISLFFLINYFNNIYPKAMPKQWIFISGIFAGCVLWMKFSLLGFWFGWMASIVIILFINKQYLCGIKSSGIFISGMLLTTMPWIIYFGFNNAIYEWIDTYFIINLFNYSEATTLFSSIRYTLVFMLTHLGMNPLFAAHLILGLFIFLTSKKYIPKFIGRLSLFFCLFFLALSVYGGGRGYIYYFLIFTPFIIFGYVVLFTIFFEKFGEIKSEKLFMLILLVVIGTTLAYTRIFNHNVYMLEINQEELVQFKFAEIINQTEDATLLNYGALDGGFYTTTGIVPNIRFFISSNISYLSFPLLIDEQNRYIKEGIVDYVVVRVPVIYYDEDFRVPHIEENYTLVTKEIQKFEDVEFYYLLYKKK